MRQCEQSAEYPECSALRVVVESPLIEESVFFLSALNFANSFVDFSRVIEAFFTQFLEHFKHALACTLLFGMCEKLSLVCGIAHSLEVFFNLYWTHMRHHE